MGRWVWLDHGITPEFVSVLLGGVVHCESKACAVSKHIFCSNLRGGCPSKWLNMRRAIATTVGFLIR